MKMPDPIKTKDFNKWDIIVWTHPQVATYHQSTMIYLAQIDQALTEQEFSGYMNLNWPFLVDVYQDWKRQHEATK
jgi:hypothetical protein